MKDKRWALNCLRISRVNFVLSLAAAHLLHDPKITETLRGQAVFVAGDKILFNPTRGEVPPKGFAFDLGKVADSYAEKPENREADLEHFLLLSRRNMLREDYECVWAYAKEAGGVLPDAILRQSWYPFARVIRNAVSHDLHFEFRRSVRKMLPASWKNVTIDVSLEGKAMQRNHLPPGATLEIHQEIEHFVQNEGAGA